MLNIAGGFCEANYPPPQISGYQAISHWLLAFWAQQNDIRSRWSLNGKAPLIKHAFGVRCH